MPKLTTKGKGDKTIATISGLDFASNLRAQHLTIDADGAVTERMPLAVPLNHGRLKLNNSDYPDCIHCYCLPRRAELRGVKITAAVGVWTICSYSRATGKLIDSETHPDDGPGVSVFRRAASLAKTPIAAANAEHLAVVLVSPLPDPEAVPAAV